MKNEENGKVLLMGRNEAGKTSMQNIIFSAMKPRETEFLMYTNKINVTKITFLGTEFTLADCGGQKTFLDEYTKKFPEQVFSNCQMLIYVFDIEYLDNKEYNNIYCEILKQLELHSKGTRVFVLVHKIDKIKKPEQAERFQKCVDIVRHISRKGHLAKIFFTSIWDDSLYNAWSQIIQSMIPVLKHMKRGIRDFGSINDCEEIVLFEKETFLIVANYTKNGTPEDVCYGRYEQITGIFKSLKLNCKNEDLDSIRMENSHFSAALENYTPNTYILIIKKPNQIPLNTVLFNLEVVRRNFKTVGDPRALN